MRQSKNQSVFKKFYAGSSPRNTPIQHANISLDPSVVGELKNKRVVNRAQVLPLGQNKTVQIIFNWSSRASPPAATSELMIGSPPLLPITPGAPAVRTRSLRSDCREFHGCT